MSYKKIIYFPFLLALLLGFSGLDEAQIGEGVRRLGQVLDEAAVKKAK